LIELVSDDCNANGIPDLAEIYQQSTLDADSNKVLDSCQIWYRDLDADGYGVLPAVCSGGLACAPNLSLHSGDCDDLNPSVSPVAVEICDGVDNDCDGYIDESLLQRFYRDADADGFGDPTSFADSCSMPFGFTANNLDCNDAAPLINPSASEVCDNIDNNCDGFVDEPFVATYCTAGTTIHGCSARISASGVASTTQQAGFLITVSEVPGQRFGTIMYSFNATAVSWSPLSSSYRCVAFPVQRLGDQFSGGVAGQCDGVLSIDFNSWRYNNPTALGSPFLPGMLLHAQGWFRDPAAPKQTNLSNAIRFMLCN
jgi:hypothetical protein